MDPERPHRSTSINNSYSNSNTTSSSSTSELFICFTSSRLLSSSSSMKISSKSILSPGRTRGESSQISLSSSLSRRLRSNGSMKGGQASPMFPPANGKKRGCGFENPEPSSPKVTCIGQVRVKTKKQGKKFRACRSKRRGEVSFIKVDHNKNNGGGDASSNSNKGHLLSNNSLHHHQQQQQECKKWVHFPLTICEALREFNCFLPCRSSCMASQRDKEGRTNGGGSGGNNKNDDGNGSSSCGAVFARWLVAVQDGEGGKQREIELVVGGGGRGRGGDDDDDYERRDSSEMMMMSSQRRHVFENIEISDFCNESLGDGEEEEEEGRVSICIPPKNALLLMRCRSDPVKMAALANKFWENPVPKDEPEPEELAENIEEVQEEAVEMVEREEKRVNFKPEMKNQEEVREVSEMFVSCEAITEEMPTPETETEEAESVFAGDETETVEGSFERSLKEESNIECDDPDEEKTNIEEDQQQPSMEEEEEEASLDLEKLIGEEEYAPEMEQDIAEELQQQQQPQQAAEAEAEAEAEEENVGSKLEEEEDEAGEDYQAEEEEEEGTEKTPERSGIECPETRKPDPEDESKEKSESQRNLLPDCLLLMMCEPKLSMEVSKETWVCSTDFIRWTPEKQKQQQHPHHHHQPALVKQKDGRDEPKRRISIDSNPIPAPVLLQPRRSSCSFPVAPPMALAAAANAAAAGGGSNKGTMNGKKLLVGGGKGYEPLLLTRCKSEPRRSSAKLAQQDACFWKNRKLEPTTLGVGAAGVGF